MASSSLDAGASYLMYYDVLLLGKTGKGKSTTGNKLLGLTESGDHSQLVQTWKSSEATRRAELPDDAEPSDLNDDKHTYFRQGEAREFRSVTKRCKLLSSKRADPESECRVRVLDTPGFADSETAERLGPDINLYQANLQSMRWIVRRQQEHELAFSRVLYFLPERGPLEKADRALQEEIKIMVHFFGETLFYNMVIIATWPPRQSMRGWPFDGEDIRQTQEVFKFVMQRILKEEGVDISDAECEPLKCPPVVYISLSDTPEQVLHKVKDVEVQGKSMPIIRPESESLLASTRPKLKHQLQPQPAPPPEPQLAIRPAGNAPAANADRSAPTRLAFRDDVCAMCAVQKKAGKNGEEMVKRGDSPELIPYKESKCHPALYPKYTPIQKFFGGVAHIATGGIPWLLIDMIFKKDSWPGWFNSDEICPKCSGPPGSVGCAPVLQPCEVKFKNKKVLTFWVDHGNTLDNPTAAQAEDENNAV